LIPKDTISSSLLLMSFSEEKMNSSKSKLGEAFAQQCWQNILHLEVISQTIFFHLLGIVKRQKSKFIKNFITKIRNKPFMVFVYFAFFEFLFIF
jgi:hypothetical protein